MNSLLAIGAVLIGLGLGVVIERSSTSPYVGYCLLAGAVLIFIGVATWKYVIAAPIAGWRYEDSTSPYDGKVFRHDYREAHWYCGQPQQVGNYYRLDMLKGRVFTEVSFDDGKAGKHSPAVWTLSFLDASERNVPFYKSGSPLSVEGQCMIHSKLERPVKARYIRVEISKAREVDNNPCNWDIRSIRIREKRLFGLWNPEIGELKSG